MGKIWDIFTKEIPKMKIIETKKFGELDKKLYPFIEQGIRTRVKTKYGIYVVMYGLAKELYDDFENDKNLQKWIKKMALDTAKRAVREKKKEL